MTRFDVDSATNSEVHDYLDGRPTALAELVDASRRAQAHGAVEWDVAVRSANVYRIDALHRLAEDENVRVRFRAEPGLDEQERAFFDDYSSHRLAASAWTRGTRSLAEWAGAAGEAADALLRILAPAREVPVLARPIDTVVIVGAYGGDHVGDAAILGGVLLALHARYGVARATVMSFRADHTRRLVSGLATPVTVTVAPYSASRVALLLDDAGALVIAGGPLVDLPRVLAKHLGSTHAARHRGRPVLIERVGVGEFHNRISMWAARRIFDTASVISVRSSDSAAHPLLAGKTVTVGRDPAFDYLATRRTLDRLSAREQQSIETLLSDAGDSLKVGINLRPVRDDWHPKGREHSIDLQQRFIEHLAQALQRFAADAPRPVTYVFFPMNAIQFGLSDLSSAYRLHRVLRGRVTLRVWETDPQVDGVLYLLRKLDCAVVMRLHAAIFAISQDLPVVGVDYFSGRDSKLTALFDDLDRSDARCSMETFESSWLVDRLVDSLRTSKRMGYASWFSGARSSGAAPAA